MFTPAISPADPNLMLINCDMSGVYLSRNGGRDWRMIHQAQLRSDTDCQPAFHPTDTNVIYASSGGHLRMSRDQGETFTPFGNLEESLQGEIAIDPTDPRMLLAGTSASHVWLSRNGGATWSLCHGPQGRVLGLHFDQTRPGKGLFASTEKGLWRSDDNGQSWAERAQGLPGNRLLSFAAGSNPKSGVVMLYCSVPSDGEQGEFKGGIFRSSDRGESWQSAMGPGINVETKKADQWAFGSVPQYRHLLATDADPLRVYAFNTSTGFHPPHHETVFRSDDGGRTWRDVYFEDPRFKRYNITPGWVTASTGQSFKGGDAPFGVAICNSDPDRIILVRNEPHITHDGGARWFSGHTYPAPGQLPGPGSAWVCNGLVVTTTWHYDIDPFETNRHYIAYTDLGMARSLDAGHTWIWWNQDSWAPWRNTCYQFAFDPDVPGKMWGAFSDVHDIPNDNIISERHSHNRPGGVCVSRDFGASWKAEAEGVPPKPVTSIVLDPSSPKGARTLYAGVFDEGVYKSVDDGRTWKRMRDGLGDPINRRVSRVILHQDGTLFASICAKRSAPGQPLLPQGVGLYRSRDGAERWEKVNASKLFLYPKDFSVDPRDSSRVLIGSCDAGRGDQSGGLYLTEDGGTTWRRIGREGPQTFGGYFHPQHSNWIYMTLTEGAPGAGLWLSRDNGASWHPFAQLPFANIQRVEFDRTQLDHIYVTTFGGSVWRGPATP